MIVFTKLVMFIDILKILFGFASWPIFDSYLPVTHAYFHFKDNNLSEYQKTFTKLGLCIDIVEILYRIAKWANFIHFYSVIYCYGLEAYYCFTF